MKKLVLLVTAVLLMATLLTGCFSGTKEFSCQGMTMTVPSAMRDVSGDGDFSSYTFTLDSSNIAIFGSKEGFADFEKGEAMTLDEYAEAVIAANGLDVLAIDRSTADYKYFRYEADLENGAYKYLTAVFKSDDGFWTIQVAAPTEKYEEETFFEYLDSVKFS